MRSVSRERQPSLRPWDIGSLGEALQQFRMLGNELVGSLKERRLSVERGISPFQMVDELPHRILFLRRQRPNDFSEAFGCHSVSPNAVYRAGRGARQFESATGLAGWPAQLTETTRAFCGRFWLPGMDSNHGLFR